jgi:uncharacterized protein YcsI (UPF0317 family)
MNDTESARPDAHSPPSPAFDRTDPLACRLAIRRGEWRTHTSGLAPGCIQANLAILPRDYASEFLLFCQRNPKPCPLLAVGDPGNRRLDFLGRDIDVSTDLSGYRIWREGELHAEVDDIRDWWRDDLVCFAIGCSFSFEQAILDAGIPLRHIEQGRNVAMYQTSIQTVPAGRFHGPMVVSMRPFKAADAIAATLISARFQSVHGAPVHIGNPGLIGISDLARPDYGDPVELEPDEIPVFWACGVTPQSVIRQARPSLCITHAPGSMLITDRLNSALAF